jgi:2-oxoglutarate dehydrogenase E2 component (dihydrolipoamide succinyltransferase)
MAQIEIILPAMGEGIIEAEITRWLVREGERVKADTPLVEVATDKVDSEIPSPGDGVIHKILSMEGDVPKVGQVIALISTGTAAGGESPPTTDEEAAVEVPLKSGEKTETSGRQRTPVPEITRTVFETGNMSHYAFISPVIRKMARDHDVSPAEMGQVKGTGLGGRITREDLLAYLGNRETGKKDGAAPLEKVPTATPVAKSSVISREQVYGTGESTIEEMDRMRKLIADHMVYSKQTAPHVTSFVESDVTGMILWREKVKDAFREKYNQKLTITALILEAVAKCLKEYPGINVSLDGYSIIRKSSINIGMATALPGGNLIVPVIPHADRLNLAGLAAAVNDLADRARSDHLKPGETQGGTFTVTNLGNFGNIAGTPVINQPEVSILAVGALHKKPAIVETPQGEAMGIRQMMILSLAYDHRIVDGALGGSFLKSIGDRVQEFDTGRSI